MLTLIPCAISLRPRIKTQKSTTVQYATYYPFYQGYVEKLYKLGCYPELILHQLKHSPTALYF